VPTLSLLFVMAGIPTASMATTACDTATGPKRHVGPGQTYTKPSEVAAAALSGDVIVISAGDYVGDVAVWPQSNLTLCGAGGRARLFAAGKNAAGKGLWVIQGANVVVDSIEFHDATVPDQNGAGIRAEGNGLAIVNAGFFDNENGILGPNAGEISITRSEFARNGFGDGYTHNVYVGRADRLTVSASFFHEARIGHNLKSRARETRIENSYFMDGPDGTSSYLVDVPNGGIVYLRGNLLQKGAKADNSTSLAFGEEGLPWPTNTLEMVHNTLVSHDAGGTFVTAAAGVQSIRLTANVFAGTGSPPPYNASVAAKVTEVGTLTSTAASFGAASNLAAPGFWPNATLAAQLALAMVPDPGYAVDAPQPFVLRRIGGSRRLVGALQSAP